MFSVVCAKYLRRVLKARSAANVLIITSVIELFNVVVINH